MAYREPRGERARTVRAIREELNERAAGSANPVVTVAMVRELRDNRRGVCGGGREGVTAVILMATAQEGMQVEMFVMGGGGNDRDAVAEAQQWAVATGWIGKREAVATLKLNASLAGPGHSEGEGTLAHCDRDGGRMGGGHIGVQDSVQQDSRYRLEKAEHRGQGMDTARLPEGVPGGEQVERGHGVGDGSQGSGQDEGQALLLWLAVGCPATTVSRLNTETFWSRWRPSNEEAGEA